MTERLEDIARALVAPGKGILAADESSGTIKKRFDKINTVSTDDSRRDYREMMFRTTDAMKNHVSGVILYDETIRQKAKDGTTLVESCRQPAPSRASRSIRAPRLCRGRRQKLKPSPKASMACASASPNITSLGARFAKWRAVITIADGMPTWNCVKANAHALARYAALCQEAGIVPIVEPEVLMDGEHSKHDIDECYRVTEWTLRTVFREFYDARVCSKA